MNLLDLTGRTFGRLTAEVRDVTPTLSGARKRASWLCLCSCGRRVVAQSEHLRSGSTKSCGCLRRENSHRLGLVNPPIPLTYDNPEVPAFNHAVGVYIHNARARNLTWALTMEAAIELMKQPCHYCGKPPSTKSRKAGILYSGIDRKDNRAGYEPANCVPCCTQCNRAKWMLPYETFITWIDRLCAFRGER